MNKEQPEDFILETKVYKKEVSDLNMFAENSVKKNEGYHFNKLREKTCMSSSCNNNLTVFDEQIKDISTRRFTISNVKKINSIKGEHITLYNSNKKNNTPSNVADSRQNVSHAEFDRHFMDALIKHTAIALAILIPLAIYSSYARGSTIFNTIISTTIIN